MACAAALVAAALAVGCYRPRYALHPGPYVPCPPGTPAFTGDSIVVTSHGGPLRGRIVDFQTGEPLHYALIRWVGTGTKVVSDTAGFFRIPVDTAGTYRISAQMLGYVRFLGVVRWTPVEHDSVVAGPDTSLALPIRLLAPHCGVME